MNETNEADMQELIPAEKMRVYYFPTKTGSLNTISFTEVTHFMGRPSGVHRLRTRDGKLHFIPTGWLRIEIDAEPWTS